MPNQHHQIYHHRQEEEPCGVQKSVDLPRKMEVLLSGIENRHGEAMKGLMLQIWTLKFQQRRLNAKPVHGHVTINDKLLELLMATREAIINDVWEIFIRSVNTAHVKKTNSLILFILNIREAEDAKWHLMRSFLSFHRVLRKIIKKFIPGFGKVKNKYLNRCSGMNSKKMSRLECE